MDNQINEKALENAVNLLKKNLGQKERENVEKLVSDQSVMSKIASSLSNKDLEKVNKIMNDPAMLNKILSDPKNAAAINKFLGGGQ